MLIKNSLVEVLTKSQNKTSLRERIDKNDTLLHEKIQNLDTNFNSFKSAIQDETQALSESVDRNDTLLHEKLLSLHSNLTSFKVIALLILFADW